MRGRWSAFERLARELGAVRLEHDVALVAATALERNRLVESFAEAVDAVSRFGDEYADEGAAAAARAWAALDHARTAARRALAAAGRAGAED